jgi:hypothetical protein
LVIKLLCYVNLSFYSRSDVEKNSLCIYGYPYFVLLFNSEFLTRNYVAFNTWE